MANNELSLSSLGIQLPYNMQAEQSVLGAALMDETILNRLITEMDPDMFYSEQNRAVYEEMRRLFSESEAVDVITLVDSLAQNGVFKGADDAKVYITRIAETVPAISNVDSYIKIVKEKYQTRRLIEAARDILQQSSEESDSDLLLESAEQKLYDIRNGQDRSGVKTIQESILEVIDTMQKLSGADRDKFAGIPTGFNYLDNILTGLGRSDLIILAARPGMGKTSFALNIATNVARLQKIPTVIFSLEMTCEQLTDRILSSTAGIDSQAFRTGALRSEDWEYLALATEKLHDAPIYMDDTSGITITEMKAKIRRVNQDPTRPNVGLIVIDYLQLMTTGQRSENRVQEIQAKRPLGAYTGKPLHFIGHLQTNKVKYLVGVVDLIESVDRLELLECIEKQAEKLGVVQNILFEVNIGNEESKSGFTPAEAAALAARMADFPHTALKGLMAIPPVSEFPGENCRYFAEMRNLFVDIRAKKYDNVSMECLSMGMSNDFADAIAEGSTMVRIGTAIFGKRNYNI